MPIIHNVCINHEENIKLNLEANDSFRNHLSEIKEAIESFSRETAIPYDNIGMGYYKIGFGENVPLGRDIMTVDCVLHIFGINAEQFRSVPEKSIENEKDHMPRPSI